MTINELADMMSRIYDGTMFRYINSDIPQGWIRYGYLAQRPTMSWSGGARLGMRLLIEVTTRNTIKYLYEEQGQTNKIANDTYSTAGDLRSKLPRTFEAFMNIIKTGKAESAESMVFEKVSLVKKIDDKLNVMIGENNGTDSDGN